MNEGGSEERGRGAARVKLMRVWSHVKKENTGRNFTRVKY